MRVVHLTKTLAGGAGIAATRTVAALQGAGVAADVWTQDTQPALGPRSSSAARWVLDRLDSVPTRCHVGRRLFSSWSNNWRRTHIADVINRSGADLVHLHWIAQGFISLDELDAIRVPLVWTLHDAWPFTGGCHYPAGCERYREGCGRCPQLGSSAEEDLSARNRRIKSAVRRAQAWISPSSWLFDCATQSGLFQPARGAIIPYALDPDAWRPMPMEQARGALGLSASDLVFVAGAMRLTEPRKGAEYLLPALQAVCAHRRVVLLVFGANRLPNPANRHVSVRYLGHVSGDALLRQAYSAADMMLMPTLQDNLPCVVMEAQACGCPVVGFASGGTGEIVEQGRTGLLTMEKTAEGLARAIRDWLGTVPSREAVIARCRAHALACYAPAAHAAALMGVYRSVLSSA